jgi:hypothetical protein
VIPLAGTPRPNADLFDETAEEFLVALGVHSLNTFLPVWEPRSVRGRFCGILRGQQALSTPSRSQVVALVEASEDDLYRLLATDLLGPQAFPMHPTALVERGKRWFSAQRQRLATTLCPNEKLRQMAVESSDEVALVTGVADIIVGMVLPVAPVTLAALIVKVGLTRLCPNWRNDD